LSAKPKKLKKIEKKKNHVHHKGRKEIPKGWEQKALNKMKITSTSGEKFLDCEINNSINTRTGPIELQTSFAIINALSQQKRMAEHRTSKNTTKKMKITSISGEKFLDCEINNSINTRTGPIELQTSFAIIKALSQQERMAAVRQAFQNQGFQAKERPDTAISSLLSSGGWKMVSWKRPRISTGSVIMVLLAGSLG
jgi:hypothetical protein